MLKYIFAFLMLMNGLIHLAGFAKAFGYGNFPQLTKEISKPAGSFWLLTAVLFIVTILLFLLDKESWAVLAIPAAIISQVLVVAFWKDAKFGTIANIIILLAAVQGLAENNVNKMERKEAVSMMAVPLPPKVIITEEMLVGLPGNVRQWLVHSGVIGKEQIHLVTLQQKGLLRTKPDSKWMPFTAAQYCRADDPAFNWHAAVNMFPLITLNGRDKFENGRGEMTIKLWSLFSVADEGGGDKINFGTMIRFLSEIAWYPTAALAGYIRWEAINAFSARATMSYSGITVAGIFNFTPEGDLLSFEADRYMVSRKQASLEKWLVEMTGYKYFNEIRIPYKCKVTRKLKTGDFNWADIELTDLEFNKPAVFPY